METIQTSAGPIAYTDSGGRGPTIVFLHGVLMDGSLWDQPAGALAADDRCVVPTLPMGAHRLAANSDAGFRQRSTTPPPAGRVRLAGETRRRDHRALGQARAV